MASVEEGEIVEDCVTNYYFVDSNQNPLSFSCLPLKWNNNDDGGHDERKVESTKHAFLQGIAVDGCQQIHWKVTAWKFVLTCTLPEIYVLLDAEGGRWIKLQRPQKSYEDIIRTVLISVHCLHFMKKNSEESSIALWKHVRKTFSAYEVPPSKKDLLDHMQWIKEAVFRDKDIAKAKNLPTFLSEMSGKRKGLSEDNRIEKRAKFIVSEEDDDNDDHYDSCEAEGDQLFDRVCAFCDDGVVKEDAYDLFIQLYNLVLALLVNLWVIAAHKFMPYRFLCAKIANIKSINALFVVFPCISATCGHFYHPQCVSELIFPREKNKAQVLQKQIQAGEAFTCPAHICFICRQGESADAAQRHTTANAYQGCPEKNISFQQDDEKNIPQRAWEKLLINRILIYCMDHKICRNILTPKRDHLLFPEVGGNKDQYPSVLRPEKLHVMSERRSKVYGILTDEVTLKKLPKGITDDFIKNKEKKPFEKVGKINSSASMIRPQSISTYEWRKPNNPSAMGRFKSTVKSGKPLSSSSMGGVSEKGAIANIPSKKARTLRTPEMRKRFLLAFLRKEEYVLQEYDVRIQILINNSMSSFNEEEFLAEQRRKCVNTSSQLSRVVNTITLGKVECLVQAIQAAMKKLQEGGTIEDAKAVCEPAILSQSIKWKKKLHVLLAPFIHGMRYTSFGRHFTKVEKLKQVVSRLRWYVQDGDTACILNRTKTTSKSQDDNLSFALYPTTARNSVKIVDFCCGSNDFSCLMKEELERMGRKCSFKNYDLIQPKNDFNFEKRDWMSVGLGELPEGSNLIMGLNPPFGVQASLANQFIEKALSFMPKLLILIVPKETERLDMKEIPYDLIWEDDQILSGKSFYLPGSVDVHDQRMEQWNLEPPPLYLWSRPDWTIKHNSVALEYGHLLPNQGMGHDFPTFVNGYGDINSILEESIPEADI
ncbi:enhanced downy mildew 1 2 [Striga asiatica]|uniref:Enhanced downy mildew 1 2 n=1 Tax=Striga asiatica TaxID=4170 RepID=A0A5A7RCJ1_STRAF|nr:enhanced downy mildew 1 2 [Striga asiatica]